MAKRAKRPAGSNGFDPDILQEIVGRYDELTEELATEKGKFMKRAKDIGELKKQLLVEAKQRGIPTDILKKNIQVRDHVFKAQAIRDELDRDAQETFDQMMDALGGLADTPLGAAAVRKAKARDEASANVDALTH